MPIRYALDPKAHTLRVFATGHYRQEDRFAIVRKIWDDPALPAHCHVLIDATEAKSLVRDEDTSAGAMLAQLLQSKFRRKVALVRKKFTRVNQAVELTSKAPKGTVRVFTSIEEAQDWLAN